MYLICLFVCKVTNHSHFLKNAYMLVINIQLKFDLYLKFVFKYQLPSWINLKDFTTIYIFRLALITCKLL